MNKVEFISKVRYLGWLCYQMGADLPLHDVPSDYAISQERFKSIQKGTEFILEHPNITPEENHSLWMEGRKELGYVYGPVLDVNKKTHPSMLPYDELSEVEKRKDTMDVLMVHLAEQLYNEVKENLM